MHEAWNVMSDSALAGVLNERLTRLLEAAERSGGRMREIQLDYDAPERRLPRWATVVGLLGAQSLRGRSVWVTSIPSHLRHPRAYGDLFRNVVAGHILQVFDTGDEYSKASSAALANRVEDANMPFRLGVGAFERQLGGTRTTTHTKWFMGIGEFARRRGFRGVWVFPAGREWTVNIAPRMGRP